MGYYDPGRPLPRLLRGEACASDSLVAGDLVVLDDLRRDVIDVHTMGSPDLLCLFRPHGDDPKEM